RNCVYQAFPENLLAISNPPYSRTPVTSFK
ncbi:MAG: hypothetical protein ACI92C_002775, partial [Neolewinella sp.]